MYEEVRMIKLPPKYPIFLEEYSSLWSARRFYLVILPSVKYTIALITYFLTITFIYFYRNFTDLPVKSL